MTGCNQSDVSTTDYLCDADEYNVTTVTSNSLTS
jgi:hypothetical protein